MLRLLLLLGGVLGCAAEQAAPLAFTMLQLTRVYRGNSMFRGNASLNGELSHVLEGNNVTQVLPLEPPDVWARRQDEVITYLGNFRQLVMLFHKERPTDCECHPSPVLPPRLPPLPQRHSPELLRGDPQQDSVPELPRPQRHLGAALARRAPGGRLRAATADEIPHNHPGPAVFPQHHLCQHPEGSERQDRKSQRPIAHSAGAGAGPGKPRPAGHGPGRLPVHGRELLAWAAVPCHPMGTGDGPVICPCSHHHLLEAGDRPIISLWSQG